MQKKIALASLLAAVAMPLIAKADITIVNNTDYYGTGKIDIFCSNIAGDKGVIKPHSPLTVEQSVLDMVCSSTCDATVYVTKDCSGKAVAKAKLDGKKGVLSVTNLDSKRFTITGGGNNITIEQVSSWTDWLKKIF